MSTTTIEKNTKDVQKNKGGRPMKYTSARALSNAINRYFDTCDEKGKVYTVTGLAYSLGMTRKGLIGYEKREKFGNAIWDAKMRIQEQLETELRRTKGQVTGTMFSLKNNFGWKEKNETEIKNTHLHLHKVTKDSYTKADEIVHSVKHKEIGT